MGARRGSRRAARVPRWGAALAIALASGGPAHASHTVFSAAVDRIEIDGNVYGAPGGALDLVDEFDDGVLAPNWALLVGSAEEAGGVVTLHDPGFHVPFGPPLDVSQVESAEEFTNGAGDGTATAWFTGPLPSPDREFNLQIYGIGSAVEAAGLTFQNLSAGAAAQMSPPAPVGYSVSQQVTQLDFATLSFHTVQTNTVAVGAASITGPIVLRFAFDDTTDLMTTSFSVNGGATFRSPFPPMPVFLGIDEGEILLGAATVGVPAPEPPRPIALRTLDVKSAGPPATRQVKYLARQFNVPLFGDPKVGGASLNVDLDGTTACFVMPAAGWSGKLGSYKYRDPGGLYGPVRVAGLKRTGYTIAIKIGLSGKSAPLDLVPPDPGVHGDFTFDVANRSSFCSTTDGGTIKPNTTKRFRVKDAPPPAACVLPSCTP